ncbi:hypothetical protein UFOVP257_382 [uncultured Caudovirales phage]|uniref:Uncharacterized protein n=1 Tax=uncultured Caudovirales phage TaxID=2100421 RepID=A0A6J5LL61_9CAUD|nr:hypothetical protein UFOVP257_382 [uncultured Caudovirales phage]
MNNLSLAIQSFNNRIKSMNQTNSRQLTLSAEEARNLHADIFNLLANIAELQIKPQEVEQDLREIRLDGGSF